MIILVQEYISVWGPLQERWPLILGVIFVVCVMLLRGGFARYLSMAWDRWGRQRTRLPGVRPQSAGEEVEA